LANHRDEGNEVAAKAHQERSVYFTQLDYMRLEIFIIHSLLATVIFFICGLWAYQMRKRTEETIENSKSTLAIARQITVSPKIWSMQSCFRRNAYR
jgi:hypothetical protein